MGFVGRAKNGCDVPIGGSGALVPSSLVFGYVFFDVFGLFDTICGPGLFFI